VKIVNVIEPTEDKEVTTLSKASVEARDKVFNLVKKLFYLTSNKDQIAKMITTRIEKTQSKYNQLLSTEQLMKETNTKLKNDITDMEKRLSEAVNVLRVSLLGKAAV